MDLKSIIKQSESKILKYSQEFLDSNEGEKLIRDAVRQYWTETIENEQLEDICSVDTMDELINAIDEAVKKRLKIN